MSDPYACVCALVHTHHAFRYVRGEFRQHLNAEPKHLQPFLLEWGKYLDDMKERGNEANGSNIGMDDLANMTTEQREQLQRLKVEAFVLRDQK